VGCSVMSAAMTAANKNNSTSAVIRTNLDVILGTVGLVILIV
jgi:hypothetical protein